LILRGKIIVKRQLAKIQTFQTELTIISLSFYYKKGEMRYIMKGGVWKNSED